MKIGVYVGSFDPIHKGHMKIVNYLLDNNYLDKIIIIPTGSYWTKENLTNIEDRLAMIKLYENDKIIINDKLNKFPYTYQILEVLKKIYKKDIMYLIIGADNLLNFQLWKNINKILENKVIIIPRNKINVQDYINQFDKRNNFIIINNFEGLDISSTKIRSIILNKNISQLKTYLDDKIIKYIFNNNLYS